MSSIPMRCRSFPSLVHPLALALVAFAAGCGGGDANGDPGDAGVDSGPAEEDGGGIPPDAILCDTDADCDDEADCTADSCNDRGFCENLRQNPMCSDGVFCNGRELCDPEAGTADERGCIAGPPETCNDNDVCTLDRCDEENDVCVSDPRDFDGDGDPDWFCDGGDCDDRDPFVNGSINELCADGKDNDCDGEVDEEDCGRPAHDLCSDALDVSGGGTFVINARGAAADYAGGFGDPVGFSCSTSTRPEVALVFTTTEARSLSIRARGDSTVAMSLHRANDDDPGSAEETCTTVDNEVECLGPFRGDQIRIRDLPAGTYYALLQDWSFLGGTEELVVSVELDDPIPPPSNETCVSPIDVSAGGIFLGDLVDVGDDITRLGCVSGSHDLAYTFTIDEPRNVDVRVASPTGDFLGFELRRTCDDAGSAVRCTSGSVASGTFYSLEAGTYFLIVDSSTETDFELDVLFREATPPPPGEDCSNPIDLALDTVTTTPLSGRTDDVRASCLASSVRDVVYEFTLAEESDVTVTATGGSSTVAELRTTCDDVATSLACDFEFPTPILRRRGLGAGTYYLIVESFSTSDVDVEVRTAPPAEPVDVSDNDICDDAHEVPATGGVFTGSTILLDNQFETSAGCGNFSQSQDATFELELSTTRRVIASTDGSAFDTTLAIHRGSAATVCSDGDGDGVYDSTPFVCNDNEASGRLTSLIDRDLAAGTYYLVVDGWGTSESGTYELDILVLDP